MGLSDTAEIKRLLALVSKNNNIFAAVDARQDILLAYYSQFDIFNNLIKANHYSLKCQNINGNKIRYNGDYYTAYCSVISDDSNDISIGDSKNIGLLISLSKQNLWAALLPQSLTYLIFFSALALLLIAFFIRIVIHKKILKPLIFLKDKISEKSKRYISSQPLIESKGNLPYEIYQIKEAFEKLLLNLQSEYQKHKELECNLALNDLAAQVAHDIRSPLAVLNSVLRNLKVLPEEEL